MRRMKKLQAALVGAALSGVCVGALAQAPQPVTLAIAGRANSAPWIAAHGRFVAVSWATAVDGGVRRLRGDQPRRGRDLRRAGPGEPRGRRRPRRRRDPAAGGAARAAGRPPSPTWSSPGTPRTQAPRSSSPDPATADAASDAPVSLQSAGAAGDRGWHALALDDQGTAHVLWLDHRGLAAARRASTSTKASTTASRWRRCRACATRRSGPAPRPIARSRPGSATAARRPWSRWPADGWCRRGATSMPATCATSPSPSRATAARTFAKPARVSEDGWAINGCPDDGPALAADPAGGVHIVWPTVIPGDEPQGALFYAPMQASSGVRRSRPHPDAGQPEAVASRRWRWTAPAGCSSPGTRSIDGVRTAAFSVAERDGAVVALRRADAPGGGWADAVSGDGAAGAGRGRRLDRGPAGSIDDPRAAPGRAGRGDRASGGDEPGWHRARPDARRRAGERSAGERPASAAARAPTTWRTASTIPSGTRRGSMIRPATPGRCPTG